MNKFLKNLGKGGGWSPLIVMPGLLRSLPLFDQGLGAFLSPTFSPDEWGAQVL